MKHVEDMEQRDPEPVTTQPTPATLRGIFEQLATGTPRRGTKLSLLLALGASVIGIAAAARFKRPAPTDAPPAPGIHVQGDMVSLTDNAPQWQSLKIGVAQAAVEGWTDPVPAYVKVDETKASRVGAPLGGRVLQVMAELGDIVKKDQPLYAVTSPDLAALNTEEHKAAVELEAAKRAVDRVKPIVEARALPEKEALYAEQQLREAELGHRVAREKLESLRVATRSDNEFVVKSPRAGRVVEKNVLAGQEVDSGSAGSLMMVADLSTVWVVADLFEADAAGIDVGTKARVLVTSLPGEELTGTVDMVSAVVDPERHTVPVRVRLDNSDGRLKPNTHATMQFLASAPKNAVEIASSAIISDGPTQYIYVREPGKGFTRRNVSAGSSRNGRVLVTHGLMPGETVVESGAILLDNQIVLSK